MSRKGIYTKERKPEKVMAVCLRGKLYTKKPMQYWMICYVIRNVALNMLNETRFQKGTKYACSKRYKCMCNFLA